MEQQTTNTTMLDLSNHEKCQKVLDSIDEFRGKQILLKKPMIRKKSKPPEDWLSKFYDTIMTKKSDTTL